jgi:Trypsin-co-occurring domain 1
MGRVVEFPLEDGGTVLVRVADDSYAGGEPTRGLGGSLNIVDRAQDTFEDAVSRILPAAHSLLGRLRAGLESPDEIRVEFGVELTAQAGAILAAASSSASFRVSVMWKRTSESSEAGGSGGGHA